MPIVLPSDFHKNEIRFPWEKFTMITVKSLHKAARQKQLFAVKKPILSNISFSVEPGKIVAIIGQNGAGKSTVIKTILGFTPPDSGSVKVREGVSVGYLPENPYYYDYLTLRELLWFSASSFGMSKADFRAGVETVARTVGMQGDLNKRLRTFSKGMTQRAGIAAAIVHDPDLLIFDEPMSGLDPVGRKMVFDLLDRLRGQGKTVLFCSHILSDVERLCDEVIILHQGRVSRQLTRSDLLLAQKGIEIVVPFSQKSYDQLQGNEFTIKRFGEHIRLYLEAENINGALDYLREQGIDVVTVQSSGVNLETVFNDVVGEGEGNQ